MKRFFYICMIIILVIAYSAVSYASIPETEENDTDNVYVSEILQKSADVIDIIKDDPAGFGISPNVDLNALYLGNEILLFEKDNSGISSLDMSYYPLCTSDGEPIGLMLAFTDEEGKIHVDYTPELISDLKTVDELSAAVFIYDRDGLSALSNGVFYNLYENEFTDTTRGVLQANDLCQLEGLARNASISKMERCNLSKIPTTGVKTDSAFRSGSVMLSVPAIKQDTGSSYCWACSFVSVGRYFFTSSAYNYDARQLAIEITGNTTTSQTVNETRTHLYNYFPMVANGHTYKAYSTGLTYLTLRTKIDSGYPILGRVENGPGHMVVVCGYANTSGDYYTMMDPITGTYRVGSVVAERPVYSSPSTGKIYSFTHRITH